MHTISTSPKRLARVTGFWYLSWTLVGFYGMLYVSPKIIVNGDGGATAKNILEHEMLFRSQIFAGLAVTAISIVLVVYLYKLLRDVDGRLALLMGGLLLVIVPASLITSAFDFAILNLFNGTILPSFDLLQRQDIAMFLFRLESYVTTASILFWGLWLFPLGVLVYRSRFLPRFIGIWLLLNGAVYVALSITGTLYPAYKEIVFTFGIPAMFGEAVLQLWLMIRGLNEKKWHERIAA